jgi:hypothetical protein
MNVYVLYNEDANCIVGVFKSFDAVLNALYMPMIDRDTYCTKIQVIDGNGIGYYVEKWDVTGE